MRPPVGGLTIHVAHKIHARQLLHHILHRAWGRRSGGCTAPGMRSAADQRFTQLCAHPELELRPHARTCKTEAGRGGLFKTAFNS